MKSTKPVINKRHTQAVHFQQQFHSGPLPSPVDLEHYNAILQGAAERILIMAEEQAKERHELNRRDMDKNTELMQLQYSERRRWQYMAFCVALSFPVIGTALILNGFSIIGTIFGGAGLVPVVWAFLPKKR